MSGFVAIGGDDPSVSNGRVLRAVTDALAFRGPDAQHTWTGRGAGLGHALLSTVDDTAPDRQPATIDGEAWITADARIDGRADLIAQLADRGELAPSEATDAQLLLHAYRTWDVACVDHVLGDFAFAIWDQPKRRMFCARDHFGVKPFYYAEPRGGFACSNTLECLRRHPAISSALDDLSVADFLLFKYSRRPEATAFRDVRRLEPGHVLIWRPGVAAAVRRYWRLQVGDEIRWRRASDYVERFRELLDVAVQDRLRAGRVAIAMSGGLDSTAIASSAAALRKAAGSPHGITAHTVVLDRIGRDEERRYAGLAAAHIGLPIEFLAADDYQPFAAPPQSVIDLPEPGDSTFRMLELDFHARLATTSRVALSGMDADAFLGERTLDYFAALIRRGRLVRLAADMTCFARTFHRRPPVGLRRMARAVFARPVSEPLPVWIQPDLVRRLGLDERWRAAARRPPSGESLRPRSIGTSMTTLWTTVFGRGDAEATRQPLEFRYPFADLRLVRFLLAVPVVPWCTDKALLREALKGRLPEQIRLRPKTTVAIDPLRPALRDPSVAWLDEFKPAAGLDEYVYRPAVPRITGPTGDEVYVNLRPLCLSRWLDRVNAGTFPGAEHVRGSEDVQPAAALV